MLMLEGLSRKPTTVSGGDITPRIASFCERLWCPISSTVLWNLVYQQSSGCYALVSVNCSKHGFVCLQTSLSDRLANAPDESVVFAPQHF